MATLMTLERYAETRAEMEAGRLRDDVLPRAGIASDEWTIAQHAWLEKMGTELERGRFELTNQYAKAFLDRQRALATPLPAPAPVMASAAIKVAPVAPAEELLPSSISAPVIAPVPPLWKAHDAPVIMEDWPAPPINAEFDGTVTLAPGLVRAALPFAQPAVLPAPDPTPAPQSPSPQPVAAVLVEGLTLEQYASLCAEVDFSPARTEETLRRYQVTTAKKAELDRDWQARFSADPSVSAGWREAYRLYFDFLCARRP